jgi:predicted transposase/invertase (TIGR01784 family)
MQKPINNIHDKFFKEVLADHNASVAFLNEYLPKDVSAALDFQSLQPEDGSFIDPALSESFADILFTVQTKDNNSLTISILLEHKSYIDTHTCFQVLGYLSAAYLKQIKAKQKPKIILPLVFYHGHKQWNYAPLATFFENTPPIFRQYIPQHETEFISLATFTDNQLLGITNGFLASALVLQKNYNDPNVLIDSFLRVLETMKPYLEKSNLFSIFVYIFQNEKIDKSVIAEKILKNQTVNNQDLNTTIMSIYDQLIAEGVEKGIERELEKTVLNAFDNQISLETIRIISGETIEKINEILKRNARI